MNMNEQLKKLKLPFFKDNYEDLIKQAATKKWSHEQFLKTLLEGEMEWRMNRLVERRIKSAKFPVIKSLESFDWTWPKNINELQIKDLFRLNFVPKKENIIFLGTVGLGKTHLASALGYSACQKGYSVLFTTAVEIINTLSAANKIGRLHHELKKYIKPQVLIMDEVGYLPIDKAGADLLFQVISGRYETGSLIISTNKPFKKWTETFNNDSTITSAVLDRVLHHCETVVIKGKSYRMKDRIE